MHCQLKTPNGPLTKPACPNAILLSVSIKDECEISSKRLRISSSTIRDQRKRRDGDRRGTWIYYRPVRENLRALAAVLDVPDKTVA